MVRSEHVQNIAVKFDCSLIQPRLQMSCELMKLAINSITLASQEG